MVINRGDKVDSYLDSDASIASSPSAHLATGGLQFDNSGIIGNQQPAGVPKVINKKVIKQGGQSLTQQNAAGL